jgi:hypothetical protein
MTNEVGFSFGPKGPGTLFFTACAGARIDPTFPERTEKRRIVVSGKQGGEQLAKVQRRCEAMCASADAMANKLLTQ